MLCLKLFWISVEYQSIIFTINRHLFVIFSKRKLRVYAKFLCFLQECFMRWIYFLYYLWENAVIFSIIFNKSPVTSVCFHQIVSDMKILIHLPRAVLLSKRVPGKAIFNYFYHWCIQISVKITGSGVVAKSLSFSIFFK